jgi:hypothetical protein
LYNSFNIISDYRLRKLEAGAQAIAAVRHACKKEIPALLILVTLQKIV